MSDASDSGEQRATRRGILSPDKLLQTMGGILLCLIGYFTNEIYKHQQSQDAMIANHDGRIVRVETKQDNSEKTIQEIKDGIRDMNSKLDRLWQAIEQRRP